MPEAGWAFGVGGVGRGDRRPRVGCGACRRVHRGRVNETERLSVSQGMILHSELSRRRIRSIKKLIRVNKLEVVTVLRVDKDKGECPHR